MSTLLVRLRLDYLELLFSLKMSRKWCTYADTVQGYASDKDAWLRMYQIQNEEDAIEIASALSVQVITSKPLRADVPNDETFSGNSQKINLAHILRLGRS